MLSGKGVPSFPPFLGRISPFIGNFFGAKSVYRCRGETMEAGAVVGLLMLLRLIVEGLKAFLAHLGAGAGQK